MTVSSGAPRWLLLASTMLATMVYTIDSTIVNVALPHMQGSLQATQEQVAWVLTSYIVIGAIATPLAGWLGTRFGLRRVLLVSIAGFTVTSMLCGVANGLEEMVAFRMLQGAFGAALVPLCQVVLLDEFPSDQHGRVTAVWGMGVLVGPVIGPTLGGWLTDALTWRWAFFINLPIGVIAYLGLAASLSKRRGDSRRPFDVTGFVLLSVALGLFQLLLDRGQQKDWFESTEIVAEAFFCVVALYMFVVHSLTKAHPFVDLRLFRDRNYVVSLAVMLGIGLAIMSPNVLLPTFLQQLQAYSPAQAGVLVAFRGLAAILAMLVAGRLIGRMDPRLIMAAGIAMSALSLWMMAQFTLDTPRYMVAVTGLVQGFGTPLTFVPLTVVSYATLAPALRTEAGVMLTLIRNLGSSIGISAVVALLARSTQVNQSYLAEHFTPYDATRWDLSGVVPGANPGTAGLLGEIAKQSGAIAYANDFYVLALTTLVALPFVFALRVRRQARDAAAPAAAVDASH